MGTREERRKEGSDNGVRSQKKGGSNRGWVGVPKHMKHEERRKEGAEGRGEKDVHP